MRAWALISYIVYLILALLAFAGLPAKAGWDGGGEPGLAFGASYNVAFVNVPVFVMGCCAGFEASYGTPPPKALTSLYSLGGLTTVASGAATGCVALFVIGIWSVAQLTAGTNPSNPFAHGGGEPTIITFMIMVLVVPLGYDLIIALCRDKDPPAAAPAAAGSAGPSSPETAIVPAADENGNPVTLTIVPANAGSHAARQCDLQEGWAMAFFRCKPLLWMASISLPFYMIHTVVLTFLLWGEKASTRVWAAPVGFPLALALAWFLTHYFEKPVGNWLVGKLGKKKPKKPQQPPLPPAVELEAGVDSMKGRAS